MTKREPVERKSWLKIQINDFLLMKQIEKGVAHEI